MLENIQTNDTPCFLLEYNISKTTQTVHALLCLIMITVNL